MLRCGFRQMSDTGSRVGIPAKVRRTLGCAARSLFIITNVGRHQYFTRKGDNIYVTVRSPCLSSLGREDRSSNCHRQSAVAHRAGQQSGQKFRLRQRGAPSCAIRTHTEISCRSPAVLPKVISEETKELLRKYGQMNTENSASGDGLE